MFRSTVGRYTILSWEMIKLSLLTALEYRTSFLLRNIGMAVNSVGFIMVWFIFFKSFPSVNGWTFSDTALLYAIGSTSSALLGIFFDGTNDLSGKIARGELDYYLCFPKNVLWHITVSRTGISDIGELTFGILILFLSGPMHLEKIILWLVVSVCASVILYNFQTIVNSVAFFVGNFEETADQLMHIFTAFTLYPQSVFKGALKFVMLTIIPAFFIATLPVSIVRHFHPLDLLYLFGFAVITFILNVFLFNWGLKRYESGNLINITK